MKVRDKFWLFASRDHDDDIWYGKRGSDQIRQWSRITPTEGAAILGIENVMMITSDGVPVPFSADAYGYMESFCRMKNVWWSAVGSAGCRVGNEEDFAIELAKKYPNLTGIFLDDVMITGGTVEESKKVIHAVRKTADKCDRKLELWATCYTSKINDYLDLELYEPLDGITVWDFDMSSIPNIVDGFEAYEKFLPNKRKMLGIYLYDYGKGVSVSKEFMKAKCEQGLQWIREGRCEGLIFLTNCNMGIGLESDYWLRDWIDEVGDQEI